MRSRRDRDRDRDKDTGRERRAAVGLLSVPASALSD